MEEGFKHISFAVNAALNTAEAEATKNRGKIMKGYYYDCPTKAAYMARSFRCDFCDAEGNAILWSLVNNEFGWYVDDRQNDGSYPGYVDVRFYLDADSHKMLEPQVGDWIHMAYIGFGVCDKSENGQYTLSVLSPSPIKSAVSDRAEIIQRNNMAFIYPETILTEET